MPQILKELASGHPETGGYTRSNSKIRQPVFSGCFVDRKSNESGEFLPGRRIAKHSFDTPDSRSIDHGFAQAFTTA
jgi:hypothetical protein